MTNPAQNKSIAHTKITDKIRVSTAAIQSSFQYDTYYQYETWCFSEDPRQRTFQKIHGTDSRNDNKHMIRDAIKVHSYIVWNLSWRLKCQTNHAVSDKAGLITHPNRTWDKSKACETGLIAGEHVRRVRRRDF